MMKKMKASVFSFAILFCLCGCFVGAGKYKMGEPFKEDLIKAIVPGKTTKKEILDVFGPPVAAVRKGTTTVKIPPPGTKKEGFEEVHADAFFELFSVKREVTEDHLIYYYYYGETRAVGGAFLLTFAGQEKIVVDRLWILINDKTGVVEDYILRKHE